jgi:uncharacterized coiled-coil DUF342 family protein
MSTAKKALAVVLLLITLSVWGCSQQHSTTGSARVRDLESRNSKLEEDYRVAVGQRDQARKKLSAAEEESASLTQQVGQQLDQLQTATKERDDLRKQAVARAGERDNMQAQLAQLGKELQNLAGRIDSAINNTTPPVPAAAPPVTPQS